jgi:hypothetical protein
MTTKIAFQYTVLRYIYDSFTGEFLNVGLAFYSQSPAFFKAKFLLKYKRITGAFPEADGEFYRTYISRLQTKADWVAEKVNSDQMSLESWLPGRIEELLLRILTKDDSAIQFGPVLGGMANDLEDTYEDLYTRLVEAHLPHEEDLSRSEDEIWSAFSKPLREYDVIRRLKPIVIHTKKDDVEFEHAWKNGRWKAMQPLSFDLVKAGSIINKARQYLGTNVILGYSDEISKVYYLLGRPHRDDIALQKAYDKGKDLLGIGEHTQKIEIIEEDGKEDFARHISSIIKSDTAHEESE